MRIGYINSFSTPKVNEKNLKSTPMKPSKANMSFKADVRIADMCYFNNNSVTDEQVNKMENLLEWAKNAYKDWGSDNLLIVLTPVIRKRFLAKDALDIAVTAAYKDPERAKKDAIEKWTEYEKNETDLRYSCLSSYTKDDDYTQFLITAPHFIAALSKEHDKPRQAVTTKEDLDQYMEYVITKDSLDRQSLFTKGQHIRVTRGGIIRDTLSDMFDYSDDTTPLSGTP